MQKKVCREIILRDLNISWDCTINPSYITKEMVSLMKKAGCTDISLGFESGSDKILTNLKKGFSSEDIIKAGKLFREYEIKIRGFLLLGGPGEDRESLEKSFSFAERLDPASLIVTPGIRIYPGTELARIAHRDGTVSKDNFLSPLFYVSAGVKDYLYEKSLEKVNDHMNWCM